MVGIIPSQSTRLMIYETSTNKFIHITDCLIKDVNITINFKYKFINGKWIISSNIETINPLLLLHNYLNTSFCSIR